MYRRDSVFKSSDSEAKMPQFESWLSVFSNCVTLGKSLSISVLQFSHLENGENNNIYLVEWLWGLHKWTYVKLLEQCLHILFGAFCFKRQGKIHFQTKLLKVPWEKLKAFKGIKLIFLGYSMHEFEIMANVCALFLYQKNACWGNIFNYLKINSLK